MPDRDIHYGKLHSRIVGGEKRVIVREGIAKAGKQIPSGAFQIDKYFPGEVIEYKTYPNGRLEKRVYDPDSPVKVNGVPTRIEEVK